MFMVDELVPSERHIAISEGVQPYRIMNRCRSNGAGRGLIRRGYRDSAPTELSQAQTPTRRTAHTFLLRGWHDWRYKAYSSARDEQSFSPVYEPIRDY
jgi:hypothetical protein